MLKVIVYSFIIDPRKYLVMAAEDETFSVQEKLLMFIFCCVWQVSILCSRDVNNSFDFTNTLSMSTLRKHAHTRKFIKHGFAWSFLGPSFVGTGSENDSLNLIFLKFLIFIYFFNGRQIGTDAMWCDLCRFCEFWMIVKLDDCLALRRVIVKLGASVAANLDTVCVYMRF